MSRSQHYKRESRNRSWLWMVVVLVAFVFLATVVVTSLNQLPEGWQWIGPAT